MAFGSDGSPPGRDTPVSWRVRPRFLLAVMLALVPVVAIPTKARAVAQAADPVIAAAGDISCHTNSSDYNGGEGAATKCRQKATSDLLVGGGLAAVLPLGDLQYMHRPQWSSAAGSKSGSESLGPLISALYEGNADVVLAGHSHTYERFAPQNPSGALDAERGLRAFVVGSGGINHGSWLSIRDNSEVRNNNTFGVLKLTLRPTSYDWQFVPEAGKTFSDTGSTNCHGTR